MNGTYVKVVQARQATICKTAGPIEARHRKVDDARTQRHGEGRRKSVSRSERKTGGGRVQTGRFWKHGAMVRAKLPSDVGRWEGNAKVIEMIGRKYAR